MNVKCYRDGLNKWDYLDIYCIVIIYSTQEFICGVSLNLCPRISSKMDVGAKDYYEDEVNKSWILSFTSLATMRLLW